MKTKRRNSLGSNISEARYLSWVLPLVLLGATAGCDKLGSAASAGAGAASKAVTAATLPSGTACERKLVTQADIAPLLSESIASVKTLAGDPQSCVFTTVGFSSVTVSLRPGVGDVSVKGWLTGAMGSPATAVTGVGDEASWSSELKELNASKGNLLCDIDAIGPASGPASREKVVALCNKIFAAL